MAEGFGEQSTSGIRNKNAPDLLVQNTGDSGGVGGPTAYFLRMCKGEGL